MVSNLLKEIGIKDYPMHNIFFPFEVLDNSGPESTDDHVTIGQSIKIK